jgi:phage FluMu protein Com
MIQVRCPQCNAALSLKQTPASGKIKCPKCAAIVNVAAAPTGAQTPAARPAAQQDRPTRAPRPNTGSDDIDFRSIPVPVPPTSSGYFPVAGAARVYDGPIALDPIPVPQNESEDSDGHDAAAGAPNPYASSMPLNQGGITQSLVRPPATALIVVSLIAIILGVLGLVMDVVLVTTGVAEKLGELSKGPISKDTQIMVRSIWGVILLIASSFVLYGAIQMKNQRRFGTARAAAIVAMIPLLGPCCILGIPFGFWAFTTLGKPGVRSIFR